MKAFLSHASIDKAFVRRINRDLKSHGFETWLDEDEIPFGGSIPHAIAHGLNQSKVILVFLSRHSVLSKWLTTEWQTKFFSQIDHDNISVIPLLLSDCEIPVLLQNRRYIDFRQKEGYEKGLSQLLRALAILKAEADPGYGTRKAKHNDSIYEYTVELLNELEDEALSLPVLKRLPIIGTLKLIPRSGKKIRLTNFRPRVRVRSVYDHLLSLAHIADCLLPHIDHGVPDQEHAELARCIAFHELNEVILGDIPTYSTLSKGSRNASRIYAEERLRSVPPKERENIANKFISMFLEEKHRKSFETVEYHLSDSKSRLGVTFRMLDKIDPIVAVWRYLHYYRGSLGDTPRFFNKKMKDFYENPDVKAFIRVNKVDAKVFDLVTHLQDRQKAWDYYEDPDKIFKSGQLFQLPTEVVRDLIEGIPLFSGGNPDGGGKKGETFKEGKRD